MLYLLLQATSPVVVHRTEKEPLDILLGYAVEAAGLALFVLTLFVYRRIIPWLHAGAEKARQESQYANITAIDKLKAQLTEFAYSGAASLAEKRFPILVQKIKDGQLSTSTEIKSELYGWGTDLKALALEHFARTYGVDLLKTFGSDYLERTIESAANATSPFPGMDTAAKLLDDGAELIDKLGVEGARTVVTSAFTQKQ